MTAFTTAERSLLNQLLIRARATGDDAAFRSLSGMAGDPAAFRAAVEGFKAGDDDAPAAESVTESVTGPPPRA